MTIKQKFQDYLELKGLSARTIVSYMDYFDKFGDPMEFGQDKVNDFVLRYNNHPPVRAFINNLKLFLITNQLVMDAKDISLVKRTGTKKRKLQEYITEQQLKYIEDGFSSDRNRLMLHYNFYLGLRVSELVSIGIFDFKVDWLVIEQKINNNMDLNMTPLLIRGKGSKDRICYVSPDLMKRTFLWLKSITLNGAPGENTPIFNIGIRRWEQLLAKAAVNTIGKKVYPHMLRHSCATWLHFEYKWDLKEIAKYLGHEDVSTTQVYTHVRDRELMEKCRDIYSK